MDARVELLMSSDAVAECLYKRVANYFSIWLPNGEAHTDIVWYYHMPQLECSQMASYVAFYDEKVDVWIDGKTQG
ncbi:hypothetical protein DEU56DRAFT_918522 [Suillus clintonianus]|uniref:uncharacterized protein n=1 Tax=Suillus clintonianus TaxID=1904413 RepID=UPI001B883CB9|nr:uncharacterized protein DEU56DRAFT_918522 [Suillus clintonianus]KAG2120043.1 hypothetical protein DEU56DRAFT_918522 [Suillus clintonianus]